jgi:hypothetical protein
MVVGNTVNDFRIVADHDYFISESGKKIRQCVFICPKCNKEFITQLSYIKRGQFKSCGCEINRHGLTDTRLFRIWSGMRSRCYNPKTEQYKNYGGKGVVICNEWKSDFKRFYDWSISNGYSDDLTIDRINVNGSYTPENCRFISIAEQNRNQTTTKLNWDMVNDIRRLSGSTSNKDLATLFWVSPKQIRDIIANKRWKI